MKYFRVGFFPLILWFCSPAVGEQIHNIAIYNFTAKTVEAVELTGPIDAALRSVLSKRGNIQLISRRAMEDKLRRLSGESSDQLASIVRSGSSLGVDYVISGSVSATGALVKLEYGLYDVKNRALRLKIKKSGSSKADIYADTEGIVDKFVAEFARGFKRSGALKLASFEAKQQAGRIKLSWSIPAASSGQRVKIYRASSAKGPFEYLAESPRTSYRDLRPHRDQNHYQLALVTADGSEHRFNTIASSVKKTQKKSSGSLFAPTILNAKLGVNSVKLAFLSSLRNTDITDYPVYLRKSGSSQWQSVGTVAAIVGASEYQFSKSTIFQPGNNYEIAVSARGSGGQESAFSASTPLTSSAAPVVTVNSEALLRRIELNWTQIALAQGYKVYRQQGEDSEWRAIKTIKRKNTLSYADKEALQDGSSYRYYVAAFDDDGETPLVAAAQGTTKSVPPASNSFTVLGGLVKKTELNWAASTDPDVAGYAVYRQDLSQSDQFERIAFLKGATNSSYKDSKDLADGTVYSYKIAAENKLKGLGDFSEVISITTKSRPQPGRFFAAAAIGDTIELQWRESPNEDIAQYDLQRQWAGQQWLPLATLEANKLDYRDTNLKPYLSVSYRLVAVDVDGLRSDYDASAVVDNPVSVDLQVQSENLLRTVELSWNRQFQIEAFNLYRSESTEPDSWKKIKKLNAAVSNYSDKTGLRDGLQYRYKLLAIDGSGELAPSNIVSAKTKILPPPPLDFVVQSGLLKSIAISWTASGDSDVAGYQIYRAAAGGELKPYQRVKGVDRSNYLDKGGAFSKLKDEESYSYQIAAYNLFATEGPASQLRTATTMALPAKVLGVDAVVANSAVNLSWEISAEADIAEYIIYRSSDSECKKMSKLTTVSANLAEFSDLDIDPNNNYCYGIVAKNTADLLSLMSDTQSVN